MLRRDASGPTDPSTRGQFERAFADYGLPERIASVHPEQNGSHEQLHKDLTRFYQSALSDHR